jgi:hypothetical protein
VLIYHYYSTTNHLEQLDPALCRPGRMDVWIEFKNASKFQAEHLFRNFFPSADADPPMPLDLESNLEPLEMPTPSSPTSQPSPLFSDAITGLSNTSSWTGFLSPLSSPTPTGSQSRRSESVCSRRGTKSEMSEIPSAVEEHVTACAHVVPPPSAVHLAELAKQFSSQSRTPMPNTCRFPRCPCLHSSYSDQCVPSLSRKSSNAIFLLLHNNRIRSRGTNSHAGLRAPPQVAPAVPPTSTLATPSLPSQLAAVHMAASPALGVLRSPFNVARFVIFWSLW